MTKRRRRIVRSLSEMLRAGRKGATQEQLSAGGNTVAAGGGARASGAGSDGPGQDGRQPGRESGNAVNRVYRQDELRQAPLSASLDENLAGLRRVLGGFPGFSIREFLVAGKWRAAMVFTEGLIDPALAEGGILRPLMHSLRREPEVGGSLLETVREAGMAAAPLRARRTLGEVVEDVLEGQAVLLVDGESGALSAEVTGFPTRGIAEPVSESVVRGPREGFVESLAKNLTLIQRRLKTPNLACEHFFLGLETHTQVTVLYIKGRANPEHLAELKRRLQRIDKNIDGVLESNHIEELIADQPLSPFPQVLSTERPDRVAAALLDGRIAILVDNTPVALVVPYEFLALMQAAEDYYQNYFFGTAIRILRYVALVIALVGPAVYVAVTTFHQEMIPEALLFSIVAARQGIPFPAVIEMLLIDYAFELLREAGIRLPRPIGQAVSIVGALVIGQAAIQAGLTSPLAVIVVAVTGIASFVLPSFSLAFSFRIIRFFITILGGILGLYGVVAAVLAILIHLAGLRTLGVPYLAGFAPLHLSDLKETVVRPPWWAMRRRPHELSKRNRERQKPGLKPGPERT
ncbi:MAG: spore germination protein [Bacillota bacterium]|uniref:spore germination protein n=1 Tax=Desulforudis sp. DRI-14 TaxID=3459793 RepID=UPI003489EF64